MNKIILYIKILVWLIIIPLVTVLFLVLKLVVMPFGEPKQEDIDNLPKCIKNFVYKLSDYAEDLIN